MLEREASVTSQLRQENVELQSRVEQQQLQLLQCKQEISSSQSQLVQLEKVANELQENAKKVSASQFTLCRFEGLLFGFERCFVFVKQVETHCCCSISAE